MPTIKKDNKISLSVVVATYNHKDYIKQCLDGILMQQTNFPFEVILGEDESDDGTREICKAYAAQYPDKIRLFLRSRKDVIYINGRPTGRFNFIENLKTCKGKYIALCEGDDYWTDPLKLQKQVDFLESRQDYIMCFTNTAVVDNSGKMLKPKEIEEGDKTYEHKDMPIFAPTLTRVFRNKHLNNLKFEDVPGGDTYLLLWQSKYGKVRYMNTVTAAYRSHDGGIWSQLDDFKKYKHLIITRVRCLKIVESKSLYKHYHIIFQYFLKLLELKNRNFKAILAEYLRIYISQSLKLSRKENSIIIKLFFLFFFQFSHLNPRTYRIKEILQKNEP